jgi:phosphoribosylamine--glycine ligase
MTKEMADNAIEEIMGEKAFGEAGNRVLIEEYLEGPEVSILAFTDGTHFVPMVSAQDHKRIFDNDEGLNTGGMGAYSPAPM